MKKTNRILFLWAVVLSAVFIGLASKSSPLYPLNDWVDVNCFFTMGRSILDGMVPYRDLYEQKGPVLYFVYAIIALFSRDSYIGVYLLEVLTFGLFLYFSGKLAQLYLGKSRTVYFILAILAACVVTSWSFTHGGSVEQNCLFILVYGMYSVLRAIRENRSLKFGEAFLNGIFAAILLWVKYTMLGFYIGLALFILIWYLSDKALHKKLLFTIGQFLLGVAAVSAVVFLYFGIYGAIGDLFTVYFYNNIFLYPTKLEQSHLQITWDYTLMAIQNNTNFGFLILSGIPFAFLRKSTGWKEGLMIGLCFLMTAIGTYWGGKPWDYYGLIFAAFCIFGLVVWTDLIRKTPLHNLWKQLTSFQMPTVIIALMLMVGILVSNTITFNQNMYLSSYSKEDTVQYRFAKIIRTVDNPTLLNYGFLDGGFYYAADATPASRYFCTFNLDSPEMWEAHGTCIANGEADFIVTRYHPLESYYVDMSHYQLVDQADYPYDQNYTYTFYLYQKIT